MSSYGDWFRRQREQEQAGSVRQDTAQKAQAAAAPSAGSGRRLELSKIDAQTARDHARLQGISDAAGARPKQQAGRTASAVQKAQSVMAAVEPGGSQIGQLAEELAAKRQTGVPAAVQERGTYLNSRYQSGRLPGTSQGADPVDARSFGGVHGYRNIVPAPVEQPNGLNRIAQGTDAALSGLLGGIGSAFETGKAALDGEIDYLQDVGLKGFLTTPLNEMGEKRQSAPYQRQMDMDSLAARLMERSAEKTQQATEGLGEAGTWIAENLISVGQNLPAMAAAAIPGIGPAVSGGIMAVSAGGSKAYELQRQGVDAGDAFWRGAVSGGIELATERFSIDNFLQIAKGVGAKTAIKNILRQAGVEASEESASYVLNYIADKAANDPNAEFSLAELVNSAAGGAFSGGVFGGVGTALDRALSNSGTQAQTTELTGTLSETPLQLVQKAGAQAAGLDSGTVEAVSGTTENVSRAAKPGVVRDAYSERVDRTTVDTIDRIAKRIGVEVEFSGRVAGNGDYRDGKIRIRTDAVNPVRQVFVHELTHHLETSGGYQAFSDRVIEHLQKSGQDVELQTAAIVQEYARQGVSLSEDGARRELVAKFAEEKLFTDARSIRRLTQADRSLGQKIRDWLHDMVIRLAGDAEQKFVQRAERMYAEALEGAAGRQTGETQYEIRYPQFTENDLAEGEAELVRMAPVAELTGREFPKGEIDLQTQVLDFFDSLGGNIFTERFGDVALTKSSWRSERRHGMTQVKAAAFAAIPQVLQNGAVVDVYEKNGGLSERIVVAAPIKIGAEAYYMGIMLQRDTQNQRLYLHDVYSEKTQDLRRKTQTWHHPEDGVSRSAEDLDMGSILQNAVNGKRRNAQNSGEDFGGQKSYGGSLSELNARLAKLSEEEKRALKAENRWQKAQGAGFDEQMFRARYEQAAEQLRRSAQVQQQLYHAAVHQARRRLELELETVRKQYPDFDLQTELDGDPRFKSLLLGDFDLLTAYQACHGRELFEAACRQMEEKARARIRENHARPVENGLQGGLPVRIGNDPSKWNRQKFREIEKRVQRGEKIYL